MSAFGLVFPLPTYRGSLVFAAGFNRIKSFDTVFGIEGFSARDQLHKNGKATDEGGLGLYSLAGAVDVSPSISLGASLNIWDGDDAFSQTLTRIDTTGAHDWTRLEGSYSFDDEYDGINLKLAAMVKTPIGLRFGMTLETPVTYSIEEDWEDQSDGERDWGFVEYEVSLPYQFGLGASWVFSNVLTVAAGAVYSDWTQVRYNKSPLGGVTKEELNEEIQNKYKDILRFHLGGEFLLPVVPITLRAGFYRDPIPFVGPREPGDPEIEITNERDFLTLGFGALIDRVLALDVAWIRGLSEQKEGHLISEEHRENRIFMSVAYRF